VRFKILTASFLAIISCGPGSGSVREDEAPDPQKCTTAWVTPDGSICVRGCNGGVACQPAMMRQAGVAQMQNPNARVKIVMPPPPKEEEGGLR
jgi:hypothetical protein